ncbi:MAG TPA: histidine phosphatase family protein [Paludibacteraceae bacterium]|nr:histidine phosphatase family protein [Paludibacteraceae bacterium]HPT44046.1 histidine phosphatase family protein [Paludibacteraceae bacterium]
MKILTIVRHAKAEQPEPPQSDFDRKLTPRGKRNAAEMASYLHTRGFKPGLIISSPAKRALQTASIFSDEFSFDKQKIVKENFLYSRYDVPEIREMLNLDAKSTDSVFLFGHNPALSWLAATLAPGFGQGLPTAGVVIIEFNTNDWNEIDATNGKVVLYKYPANLI